MGKTTAEYAIAALDTTPTQQTYIVGLTGLPKEAPANVQLCVVVSRTTLCKDNETYCKGFQPVKTFHTNPAVGAGLTLILEDLLAQKKLALPQVEVLDGGLGVINDALDRLRRGEVGGGRLVVRLDT